MRSILLRCILLVCLACHRVAPAFLVEASCCFFPRDGHCFCVVELLSIYSFLWGPQAVLPQLSEEELIDIMRVRKGDAAPDMTELLENDAVADMMDKHDQADLKSERAHGHRDLPVKGLQGQVADSSERVLLEARQGCDGAQAGQQHAAQGRHCLASRPLSSAMDRFDEIAGGQLGRNSCTIVVSARRLGLLVPPVSVTVKNEGRRSSSCLLYGFMGSLERVLIFALRRTLASLALPLSECPVALMRELERDASRGILDSLRPGRHCESVSGWRKSNSIGNVQTPTFHWPSLAYMVSHRSWCRDVEGDAAVRGWHRARLVTLYRGDFHSLLSLVAGVWMCATCMLGALVVPIRPRSLVLTLCVCGCVCHV